MAYYINNVAAADAYTPDLSLGPFFDARSAVITVANNAALMQFAVGKDGKWHWTDEREYFSIPQSFKVGNIVGIRFRNANAGQVARVLCTLTNDTDDVQFESGLPFTGTLNAQGGISSAVIVPSIALAAFPPANPQDGQLVSLVLPSSYDPIGGKAIRWLCEYDTSLAMWHVRGQALASEVATDETTLSATYADLATLGPSVTLPRAGDYEIEIGAVIRQTNAVNNEQAFMSYAIGGSAASDADRIEVYETLNDRNAGGNFARARWKTGLAAAATILAKYKTDATCRGEFLNRWMSVTPLRIT